VEPIDNHHQIIDHFIQMMDLVTISTMPRIQSDAHHFIQR
jgi:hypothetical protein